MASVKRTPATNERLQELRRRRDAILAVTPVRNQYTFEGTKYTKRGYDELLKKVEADIAQVEKELSPTVFETTQAEAKSKREITQETQKVRLDYNSVQARRKDIEKAISRATTVEEQTNLQAWLALFNENELRLKTALDQYESGRRPQNVPQPIQLVAVEQMKKSTPIGPTAPEPGAVPQPAVVPSQVAQTGPVPVGQREQMAPTVPTTPSRMPTLDEVNKQRTAQGLRALVVRNGRVVDPTTGQEVPNVSTTAPGQGAVVTPTVPGGGTGGAAVGGTPTGTVPPAAGTQLVGSNGQVALIPPSWEEAARMEAGAWWDIFKDNEEMRKFIADWMARPMVPGADPFGEAFDLALRKTNWWRTTSATVRSWTELEASDPATASARLEANISVLKKLAMDRGLSTDEALLRKAGLDVSKFGLSPEVALNNLASGMLQTSTGASELRQGFYGQSVRQLANKYGISLSDSAITNNAGQVATGQQTLASLEAQFREQAKIMYPSLAGGLDRGLSFQDMASPYARYASNILEIPEEQIDFTDPKWSAAFNTRDDKGNLSQMSFSEWADYLRKDPQFGWEYTDNAKSQVYDIALQIGRMFGRAG